MKIIIITFFILLSSNLFCFDISGLKLPKNFKVDIYAKGLITPRGLTITENDILFVGSKKGNIYKITKNKDVTIIGRSLKAPIGIDYYNNDLYVSEIHQIRVYKDILFQEEPYNYTVLTNDIPDAQWHGWKYIKVGNDSKLYINIGAPCNACLRVDKRFATIMRVNLDGTEPEIFVKGVRNSVGFDWHPVTGDFWFTDNGRDNLGDNLPPDEINKVSYSGEHFGFPYLHGKSVKDPKFYELIGDTNVTVPEFELPAHVAALGMRFYTGNMFPQEYKNGIFIAEHGSWNRSNKIGYRVSFLKMQSGKIVSYDIFLSGWLQNEKVFGRPVDLEILSDGSIVISDDYGGKIFRVYYSK